MIMTINETGQVLLLTGFNAFSDFISQKIRMMVVGSDCERISQNIFFNGVTNFNDFFSVILRKSLHKCK